MLHAFYLNTDGGLEEVADIDRIRELKALQEGKLWLDLEDPSPEEVQVLDDVFGFHPLTIEDCMHPSLHAKVDDFPGYFFIVLLAADKVSADQEDPALLEIDFYLSRHYLVTFHRSPLAAVGSVRRQLQAGSPGSMAAGVDFLFYQIVDVMVDNYFVAVRRLGDAADEFEDLVLEEPNREHLAAVNDLKYNVSQLRRAIFDQRMVLRSLVREGARILSTDVLPYIEDVEDNFDRIIDRIELCRETVASARDLYLTTLGNKTNDTMRILTIFATLLVPATVVSSIYGMNIPLPFEHNPATFWVLMGGAVTFSLAFLGYCRYRHWL
ncbi:MAG: magnesium transporter CorA family protein [Planctomycetes bacterium]|nr:magnesium transporter CorA family protein [Planctomycetota bacterium]